jgi:mannose-6-phosphate isomerase-like protein (cupin superfamily)
MADWTRRNFDDVPDRSPEGSEMAWRFARRELGFGQVGVSRFSYPPGARFPFAHRHREQEEAYVVVTGSGLLKLDDELIAVGPWDVVRVGPSVTRQFEAGPDGLEVICVGGPVPEGGDGERVDDFWA